MKITTPNGTLVVDQDITISINQTNPMFNDQGSYSLPFSVPWCDHNLKILNHPERLTQLSFIETSISATIEVTGFKARGVIFIEDLVEKNSIELSFTFDNGSFWEWAKKTNLPQIAPANGTHAITEEHDGEGVTNWPGGTFHGWLIKEWLLTNYVGKFYPEVPFTSFPVCIKKDIDNVKETVKDGPDFDEAKNYLYNLGMACYWDTEYSEFQVKNAFHRINAPVEYNFTGFIFVRSALDWILNQNGYRWATCDFDDVPELNKMVIINNADRPFRDGEIRYSEMLPDVSIEKFITSLEQNLGCVFFFNEYDKTVSVRFWNNLLSQSIHKTINGWFDSPNIKANNQNLSITPKPTSSDYTNLLNEVSEAELRAVDNFLEENQTTIGHLNYPIVSVTVDKHDDPTIGQGLNLNTYPYQVMFVKSLQAYFHNFWEDGGDLEWNYMFKALHSMLYPYLSSSDFEDTKKIEPFNEFGCMIIQKIIHYQLGQTGYPDDYPGNDYFHFFYNIVLPFVSFTDNYKIEKFANHEKKVRIADDKICFMFYRGTIDITLPQWLYHINSAWDGGQGEWELLNQQAKILNASSITIPWGSVDVYDPLGSKMDGLSPYYPDLDEANIALRFNGEHSLMQFYEKYQEFLNNGYGKAKLFTRDLKFPLDLSKLYRCDGQNFFIDKIDIVLDFNGIKSADYEVVLAKKFTVS